MNKKAEMPVGLYCRRRYSVLLSSWSLVESNMHAYWLTYGCVAMAKSKHHTNGQQLVF